LVTLPNIDNINNAGFPTSANSLSLYIVTHYYRNKTKIDGSRAEISRFREWFFDILGTVHQDRI
jgi:hypothetical protein